MKIKESLAVYIDDVLMMNIPVKQTLNHAKFILRPKKNNTIEAMYIYEIAPNRKWPSGKWYKTPDQVSLE